MKRVWLVMLMCSAGVQAAPDATVVEEGPRFTVSAEPADVPQGGVIVVRVRPLEAPVSKVTASFNRAKARGFEWSGGEMIALLPVHLETQLGAQTVHLGITDGDGRVHDVELPVSVRAGDFDTDELGVGKSFTDPNRKQRKWAREDSRAFAALWAKKGVERTWRGNFERPTETRVTARYGTFRTLNGKTKSRHKGLDLQGRTGDPIRATNDGVVIMARKCFYSGNTVVIDHGNDVHSLYFHMNAFKVEPGAKVKRGQVIGTVGKTGRVTGPHLHFGIKLSQIYVDPEAVLALGLDDDPLREAGLVLNAPVGDAPDEP